VSAQTLLVVLAHPDDEVVAVGTIAAQRARGDRVVVVWLTHGEMTEAFGPLSPSEVAALRVTMGHEVGEILGAETHFFSMPDTALVATPDAAAQVARLIAEVRPHGLLTWGQSWVRGFRHPDHEAAGKIARDALTLARIAKVVAPLAPYREECPIFTYRGEHSALPAIAINVESHVETIFQIGRLYHSRLGFPDSEWLEARLRAAGGRYGIRLAEEFDSWESGEGVFPHLLPPPKAAALMFHPSSARGGG
jgi:LmbE family N-acetylglucosaminyl deacetylase